MKDSGSGVQTTTNDAGRSPAMNSGMGAYTPASPSPQPRGVADQPMGEDKSSDLEAICKRAAALNQPFDPDVLEDATKGGGTGQ